MRSSPPHQNPPNKIGGRVQTISANENSIHSQLIMYRKNRSTTLKSNLHRSKNYNHFQDFHDSHLIMRRIPALPHGAIDRTTIPVLSQTLSSCCALDPTTEPKIESTARAKYRTWHPPLQFLDPAIAAAAFRRHTRWKSGSPSLLLLAPQFGARAPLLSLFRPRRWYSSLV